MITKISTLKLKDYLKTIIPECNKWTIFGPNVERC